MTVPPRDGDADPDVRADGADPDAEPAPRIGLAEPIASTTGATAAGDDEPYGRPGVPVNRTHPFYIGFMGALGVLTAYALVSVIGRLTDVITLVVVALFLALGLEPVVRFLQRRGLRRGVAVAVVFLGVIAAAVGFGAAVVPAAVEQGTELTRNAPELVRTIEQSTLVQQLDKDYGVIETLSKQLQQRLANGETVMQLFGGVFGAGLKVVSGAFSVFTVVVLALYFTASMRPTTQALYRLAPASRRPRVQLLADEIIRRIGGYIAGQIAVASINGFCTYILLVIVGLPYALLLAITVGVFGLVPLVGATLGGALLVVVALFHSWQLALVVLAYYVVYQQIENYLIAPRIMQRTVSVPTFVAIIAALAGGTLLGVVGALLAIPTAAAILLLVQEVLVPRQERS